MGRRYTMLCSVFPPPPSPPQSASQPSGPLPRPGAWRTENSLPPSDRHSRERSMTRGFTCRRCRLARRGRRGMSERRRISSPKRPPQEEEESPPPLLPRRRTRAAVSKPVLRKGSPLEEMSPSPKIADSTFHAALEYIWRLSGFSSGTVSGEV